MTEDTATTAEPEFVVEDYTPPAPSEPAHTETVRKLIALGEGKQAAFRYPTEDAALSALKSWQGAARYLNVSVKRVELVAEGKGKDAHAVLRVRIGERITRTRKTDAEKAAEQTTEQTASDVEPAQADAAE